MAGTGRFFIGDTHIVFQTDGSATATVNKIDYATGGMVLTDTVAWTSLFDAMRDGARKDVALCRFLGDAAPFHKVEMRVAGTLYSNALRRDITAAPATLEPVPYTYALCTLCGWTSHAFLPADHGDDLDAAGDAALTMGMRSHGSAL